jgi:hypothetical protein
MMYLSKLSRAQVGYMVKGDSQISAQTRIAFCTYGVLLRRLQADPTLSAVSTVVLDEVHERGIDSDFTLALLMSALARRPDLKLILMVRSKVPLLSAICHSLRRNLCEISFSRRQSPPSTSRRICASGCAWTRCR